MVYHVSCKQEDRLETIQDWIWYTPDITQRFYIPMCPVPPEVDVTSNNKDEQDGNSSSSVSKVYTDLELDTTKEDDPYLLWHLTNIRICKKALVYYLDFCRTQRNMRWSRR